MYVCVLYVCKCSCMFLSIQYPVIPIQSLHPLLPCTSVGDPCEGANCHISISGIVTGVGFIPSALALAQLAGLPPVYGLYGCLMPVVSYALLGTCRHALLTIALHMSLLNGPKRLRHDLGCLSSPVHRCVLSLRLH